MKRYRKPRRGTVCHIEDVLEHREEHYCSCCKSKNSKDLPRCIAADMYSKDPKSKNRLRAASQSTISLMTLLAASRGYSWLACTCTKERESKSSSACHASHKASTGGGRFWEATHGPRCPRLRHGYRALARLRDYVSIRPVYMESSW
jgi:hypothetical protein